MYPISSFLLTVWFVFFIFYCTGQVSSEELQTNEGITTYDESSFTDDVIHEDTAQYRFVSSDLSREHGSKISQTGHVLLPGRSGQKSLTTSIRMGCTYNIRRRWNFQPNVYGATCVCPNRSRGRMYAMDDTVKTCVKSCMLTHQGNICLRSELHSGFEDEFSTCCSSCNGRRSIIDVTNVRRPRFRGRFQGCVAAPRSTACRIESTSFPSLVLPNIHKKCKCGRSSSGRIFVVCDSLKRCMNPCMSGDEGNICKRSTITSLATSQFLKCCNTCTGHIVQAKYGPITYTSCI